VRTVSWPFHPHLVGDVHGELTLGNRFGQGTTDRKGELFGGHPHDSSESRPCLVRPASAAAATGEPFDSCQQVLRVKRLGHELVDGELLGMEAVGLLSRRGDHDDRDVLESGIRADGGDHRPSVPTRHTAVRG